MQICEQKPGDAADEYVAKRLDNLTAIC